MFLEVDKIKRLFLFIFCSTLIISPIMAQSGPVDFTMRGAASQEMKTEGFVGAHPSLPINSKAKISNPQNGKEIEITIIGRIEPSLNRIIDLSPAAISALDIKAGDTVVLTVSAPPRPVSGMGEPIVDISELIAVNQESSEIAAQQEAVRQETARLEAARLEAARQETARQEAARLEASRQETARLEAAIQEAARLEAARDEAAAKNQVSQVNQGMSNDYLKDTGDLSGITPSNNENKEFLAWLMAMTLDSRDARESREMREAREIREAREAREIREMREAREMRETREARDVRENLKPENNQSAADSQIAADNKSVTDNKPAAASQSAADIQPAANNKSETNNQLDNPSILNYLPGLSNAKPELRAASNLSQSKENNLNSLQNTQSVSVKPDDIQIIPGLPDRNSGKTYRLQVGSYSTREAAAEAAELVKTAGFTVQQEYIDSFYRILATNINSIDVYPSSVRLGSLGFSQIWVRE